MGNNRITDSMIFERWRKATGSDNCYTHIKNINLTRKDFINRLAYGITTMKIESIVKFPKRFLVLVDELHGKQTYSHTGFIRTKRSKGVKKYKQNKSINID